MHNWISLIKPNHRSAKSQPSFSRLESLPYDIFLLILAYLEWPHDFHPLSLTSHTIHNTANAELYRTVVIAYLLPYQTLRVLTKLENDAELSARVRTLIFDDRVKTIGPRIPPMDKFGEAHSSDLENSFEGPPPKLSNILSHVHHKLYAVLPMLYNIRSVYLNRPHPALLSPPLQLYPPRRTLAIRLRDAISHNLPFQRRHNRYYHSENYHLTEGPHAIALFLTHCTQLRELIIFCPRSLRSFWTPSLVGTLTTITIGLNLDSVIVELDIKDFRATLWNGILRRAIGLKTLAILNTWVSLRVLLEGCSFPCLEALEWFGFRQKEPKDPSIFLDFLRRHPTIRRIALSPVAYIIGNWGYVVEKNVNWLDPIHTDILPNLSTLRLHNWEAYSSPQPIYTVPEDAKRTTAIYLCSFIRHRPTITDIALTSFPPNLARILADELTSTRKMRRLLIGRAERASRNASVPLYAPAHHYGLSSGGNNNVLIGGGGAGVGSGNRHASAAEVWAFKRRAEYLQEAWESYEVMFKGLVLERSGWRPYLLPKNPKVRRDYTR